MKFSAKSGTFFIIRIEHNAACKSIVKPGQLTNLIGKGQPDQKIKDKYQAVEHYTSEKKEKKILFKIPLQILIAMEHLTKLFFSQQRKIHKA